MTIQTTNPAPAATNPPLLVHVEAMQRATRPMTMEEIGAFGRLLAFCARDGSIPDNDEDLAAMLGVTDRVWRHWRRAGVLDPFTPDPPNRCFRLPGFAWTRRGAR